MQTITTIDIGTPLGGNLPTPTHGDKFFRGASTAARRQLQLYRRVCDYPQ
jgi:hypothetical protein